MSAKRPETFSLDRLQTPIGTAMLVTDADGVLRAFDWEDHASRMNELLRLQYGAVILQDARAPQATRAALSVYFKGDLAALSAVRWRVAGTPFQRKVWTALSKIPPGTTMTYGALAAQLGMLGAMRAVGHLEPAQRRGPLPSPDRRQWFAGQIWWRACAQAMAARA